MIIHLEIKAEDIPKYRVANECPITKALRRAGHNWKDVGVYIEDGDTGKIVSGKGNESYSNLVKKVVSMYHTYKISHGETVSARSLELARPIPIEDFEYDLVVDPLN